MCFRGQGLCILFYIQLHVCSHKLTQAFVCSVGRFRLMLLSIPKQQEHRVRPQWARKHRQDDLRQGQTLSGCLREHLSDCASTVCLCVHAHVLLKCAQTWLCYWYCGTGSQLSDRNCVSFPSLLGGAVGFSCHMPKTFKLPRKEQQLTSSSSNFQKKKEKKKTWMSIYLHVASRSRDWVQIIIQNIWAALLQSPKLDLHAVYSPAYCSFPSVL